MAASMTTRRLVGSTALAVALCFDGCVDVDPGETFRIADTSFDADYFFCHVEPELLVARRCGPGDAAKGDASNSCHFTPSAVSGMVLADHPVVDCGGNNQPVDRTQVGAGSAAASNLSAVSLEMDKSNYLAAPLFVRPSGTYHPRPIFDPSDAQVRSLLSTWASK